MTERYDTRRITADQSSGVIKEVLLALDQRSHAEGSALMESSLGYGLRRFLNEQSGFTCDWVKSDLTYPADYTGLRPIEEQIGMIADKFRVKRGPALALVEHGLPELPDWAEGWGAFPLHESLPGKTYWIKVRKALVWLNNVCGSTQPNTYRGWTTAQEGIVFKDHVRPHFVGGRRPSYDFRRHRFASDWLRAELGQILIAPVQMGALRKGQSDRMVRAQCMRRDRSEFPLGAFEVACLLAMHPERVPVGYGKSLRVNAPGDVYNDAGHRKSRNCDRFQMARFSRKHEGQLPSFHFGGEGVMEASNGPVTAST